MKHSGLILVLSCLVITITALPTQASRPTHHSPKRPAPPIAHEDDEQARVAFDRMRFADPKTGLIPNNIRQQELRFASTLPVRPEHVLRPKAGSVPNAVDPIQWHWRGPVNIGGRTRALGIDIKNENIVLAGGTSGGIYRSVDQGRTWTRRTPLNTMPSVSSLAQDPRAGKTNIWYYGTGELGGNTAAYPLWLNLGVSSWGDYYGNGIYKSTDDGLTWNVLPSTTTDTVGTLTQPFNYVNEIAVDPSSTTQDVVYAAVAGGIERSSDGGATWTMVLGDLKSGSGWTDVAVTNEGVVYAVLGSYSLQNGTFGYSKKWGFYRSSDGIHWTNLTPTGWQNESYYVSLAIAPSNQHVVYVAFDSATSRNDLWKYTYISGDGSGAGGSFEDRSDNVSASDLNFTIYVRVKPDDENTVFIGGLYLERSTDGFATADHTQNLNVYNNVYKLHVDQDAMAFLPSNPSVMLVGTDGGVARTDDNRAANVLWTSLDNDYRTAQFYTVAIDHSNADNDIIVGGMQDNSTYFTNTKDSSQAWLGLFGGDGSYCAMSKDRGSYYVSLQSAYIYREVVDDDGNLLDYTRVDPTNGTGYIFIDPFVLDPNNTDRMYLAGGQYLWRNSDLTQIDMGSDQTTSTNWTRLSQTRLPSNSPFGTGAAITAIGITSQPSDRVYFGTNDGQIFRLDSASSGNHKPTAIWNQRGLPSMAYTSCIAVDPENGDRAIAVFANYGVKSVFMTTDAGETWVSISGNLEEHPDGSGNGPSCRWASILHTGNDVLYLLATSTGLYSTKSLNGDATTWELEGASTIGNAIVNMLDVRPLDGEIAVATCGNGVFSANVPPASSGVPHEEASSEVRLEESFPNPVIDHARFRFVVDRSQRYELSLFNILGEKMLTVFSGFRPAGTSETEADLSSLTPGRYVGVLRAEDGHTSTVPVVIAR